VADPYQLSPVGSGERLRHWKTVYNRQRRWSADGTWANVLDELRRDCDHSAQAGPAAEWSVGVDSTVLRAHQHPADTHHAPPPHLIAKDVVSTKADTGSWANDKESSSNTDREALGRSLGGLTTTIHLAADARARPISRVITPGQRHDSVRRVRYSEWLAALSYRQCSSNREPISGNFTSITLRI
jgi:hypothetical protein